MPSRCLILCHSLLLPSIFPSTRVFSNESVFESGDQNREGSASASVLPLYIQDWFPLGLTGLISLQSKGLLRVFSNTTIQKHQFFSTQLYGPTLTSIHDYWKNQSLEYMDLCWQSQLVKRQLFNMLSRLVIAFLPRSKRLFNFMAAVTICNYFGAQENKVSHCFHCFPIYCHKMMGPDAMILVFWCWVLSQLFHSPLSPL